MLEINKFLWETSAERFYSITPNICKCEICQKNKKSLQKMTEVFDSHLFIKSLFDYGNDYVSYENRLKGHYINSIKEQMAKLERKNIQEFLKEKKEVYDTLANKSGDPIAKKFASHIPRWIKVLEKN